MKKLTLSADPETIKQAKRLARQNHTNVSAMFERLIRMMSTRGKKPADIGPITRELSGIISLPKRKKPRDVLVDALMEKHGLNK